MFSTVRQPGQAVAPWLRFNVLALIVAALGLVGCGKSSTPTTPDSGLKPQGSIQTAPILKFHWLGKQRLAAEANATNFMAIWNLPESARLEAQTLDKLATAPWRLWATNVPLSNAPSALLRPLLDDLVQHELYVEATGGTNQPTEYVIALRLPADRAALWETNLPAILSSLGTSGGAPAAGVAGSQLPAPISHLLSNPLRIVRTNDWTLLSLIAPAPQRGAGQGVVANSHLLSSFTARLATNAAPYAARATNYWVEVDFHGASAGELLGLAVPSTFPYLTVDLIGDGLNVRTRGTATFPSGNFTNFAPWNLPTQFTVEPLTGFTVARSYQTILEQLGVASTALAGWPEQFMIWQRAGAPLQMYFSYPTTPDTNRFQLFGNAIMDWINNHSDARLTGRVVFQPTNQTYYWNGLSMAAPSLRLLTNPTNGSAYVIGGFGITPMYKAVIPEELHRRVFTTTNLVYFAWEHQHDALPQWRYLDDISRIIFDAAHRSRLHSATASVGWIQTNLALTNLSHVITEVNATAANELSFSRRSTLGLSSFELNLLLNWIQMPEFPGGMASFWRTNATPYLRPSRP